MLYDLHIRLYFDEEVCEPFIKKIVSGSIGSTLLGPSECVHCGYYVDNGYYVIVPRFKIAKRNIEKITQVHVRHLFTDISSKIKSSVLLRYEEVEHECKVLFDSR